MGVFSTITWMGQCPSWGGGRTCRMVGRFLPLWFPRGLWCRDLHRRCRCRCLRRRCRWPVNGRSWANLVVSLDRDSNTAPSNFLSGVSADFGIPTQDPNHCIQSGYRSHQQPKPSNHHPPFPQPSQTPPALAPPQPPGRAPGNTNPPLFPPPQRPPPFPPHPHHLTTINSNRSLSPMSLPPTPTTPFERSPAPSPPPDTPPDTPPAQPTSPISPGSLRRQSTPPSPWRS